MKRFIFTIYLIVYLINLYSIDFKKIEEHVANIPASKTKTTRDLSAYLTNSFKQEDEKFAAIYFWIAKNIDYDVEHRYDLPHYNSVDELILEVMKTKKGVCQHYSDLFNKLSRLAGLTSYVVRGYGKEYGKVMDLAHAWNAIKVNGVFYLVDATWGAGHINRYNKYERDFNLKYFMVQGNVFIDDHISFDPMWQLLKRPLYFEEFESGVNSEIRRDEFHYIDTITQYFQLSPIDQIKSKIRRIEQNGKANSLVKFELEFEGKNLRILEYNEQIRLFNQANVYYNEAVNLFNEFNNLKRKKVRGTPIGTEILRNKMASAEKNVLKAEQLYDRVKSSDSQFKFNLKKAKANVLKLKNYIEQQKIWLLGLSD